MRVHILFTCALAAVCAFSAQALPILDTHSFRANIETPFAMVNMDTVKHCTRAKTEEVCDSIW